MNSLIIEKINREGTLAYDINDFRKSKQVLLNVKNIIGNKVFYSDNGAPIVKIDGAGKQTSIPYKDHVPIVQDAKKPTFTYTLYGALCAGSFGVGKHRSHYTALAMGVLLNIGVISDKIPKTDKVTLTNLLSFTGHKELLELVDLAIDYCNNNIESK